MQCPSCKHDFKKLLIKDVQLDQCIGCGGMWFSGDTLRNAKDREDELLQWLDVDLFSNPKQFIGSYSTMMCPHDQEPLYQISYDNTDIKVDVCKTCHGVWLDKNEYADIIASLKRIIFREDAGQYLKHLEDQIKEMFTGQEDMVSELKDGYVVFRLLENRLVSQWPRIEEIIIALRTTLLK